MAVCAVYALIMLFTALGGKKSDANDSKLFRITLIVSLVMFALDYLFGTYMDVREAIWAFSDRMGIMAILGIALTVLSGMVMVVAKTKRERSATSTPDFKTIRGCLGHGIIITFIALVLRWAMTGKV